MLKQVLILVISSAILIFSGLWEIKYIENSSRYLLSDIEYSKNALKNNNFELAKQHVKNLENTWESMKKTWKMFVLQEEIDEVDNIIATYKIHKNEFVNYLLNTTYVEFSYGGYFEGCHTIIIEKDEENHCYISSSHFMKSEKKELSLKQFENILKTLYQRAYVLEWKRRYVDYDILDGTQWELKIKCKGVRQLNIYGSNQYPPLFNTVKNLFKKFFVYETFDY